MERSIHRILTVILLVAVALGLVISFGAPAWAETDAASTTSAPEPGDEVKQLEQLLDSLLNFIEATHVNPPDPMTLLRSAIDGMFRGLEDPHSAYLSKAELDSLDNQLSGQLIGIGVRIELRDGLVTVIAPLPNSPAERAGIRADDHIVAVNGVNLEGKSLSEASALIRGEVGSPVTITVKRGAKTFDLTLIREVIKISAVTGYLLDSKTAYIRISEFSDGVAAEFASLISKYQVLGVDGVILDLRNNPGGLLSEGVGIISELMPDEYPIAVFMDTRDETIPITVAGRSIQTPNFKLVILVDGGSASAAELVAGSLQDTGAATIVGERTYGKGTVQQIYRLANGDGVKLTIGRYRTAGGKSIDGVGVTPDVIVSTPEQAKHVLIAQRSMTKGLVGLDVLQLEESLSMLGYNPGLVDGVYDDCTAAAVAMVQGNHDLPATGISNADTICALNIELAAYDARVNRADPQLDKARAIVDEWRRSH